jgi:CspA family cold shock protein
MNAFHTPPGEGERLSGKIKWFNRSKGFGFIVPNDGSGDVFLPLAVLERSGYSEAPDGAKITFEWVQGPKGRAATQIVELDVSSATPRPPRDNRGPRRDREEEASGPTEQVDGVVKWYDPARGFGFVLPNDGGKDVFVHVTALRRAGIDELQPGQSVRMQVSQARRGREAASIQLIS